MTAKSPRLPASAAALFAAVRAGNRVQVELLAQAADLNCVDNSGSTLVLEAAVNGHREVANYLVNLGAPVIGNERSKTRPIHEFARRGWTDLVEVALDAGENPAVGIGSASAEFSSALALAVQGDHYEAVRIMAAQARLPGEQLSQLLGNLLHMAPSAEMVIALTDHGADLTHGLVNDKSPLFSTVENAREGACRALIEQGAELEARWCGFTALYYAAMHDEPGTLIALVEAGAQIEGCGLDGQGLLDLLPMKAKAGSAYAAWSARNTIRDVIRTRASQGIRSAE